MFSILKVRITMEDLRLASSQYVMSDRPGYLNYEKLLSFIASAIKLG